MKWRWILFFLCATAGVAVLGAYLFRAKPVPVIVVPVERGQVEATVSNTRAGTIKACERSRLAPAIGGQIALLEVHKGDRVKAGDLLLEIWNEDLKAQVKLAQAQVAEAEASAAEACALAGEAEREADRRVKLRERHLISPSDYDRASTDAKAKGAACQAAEASVLRTKAQVEAAQASVDRTILRAPFDGVVAEVNGEIGEFVTPSPTGVATLPVIDLIHFGCIYVSAPIDEVDAPEVKVGLPARIRLDAFRGTHFEGRVRRIAPYVLEYEKQARTVDVEVDFSNPKLTERILPGYSADVEIIIASHDHVLRIPTDALLQGNRVLLYRPEDGRLEAREIKTGLSNWRDTEVVSGLKEGDLVVTSLGRQGVKAGVKARPEAVSEADQTS